MENAGFQSVINSKIEDAIIILDFNFKIFIAQN